MSLRILPQIYPDDFCYKKSKFDESICSEFPVNTDCKGENQLVCENCKNKTLSNQYISLNQGTTQNLLNMKAEYQRSWYQTGNLGIGIFFLLVGIYYQK